MCRVPDARLVVEDVVAQARRSRSCPSVPTRCCTQPCWNVEFDGTLASFGSLPVTFWPLVRTPLPASANHCQSFPVCAPYLAMEKLASLLRFAPTLATQSIVGIVSIAWAFAAREFATNVSPRSPAVALAVGDALEVPVVAAIVGVQLPVVARGVVAAVAVERRVQVVQIGRRRVRDAVDVRVDRMAIRRGVDADRDGCLRLQRDGGRQQCQARRGEHTLEMDVWARGARCTMCAALDSTILPAFPRVPWQSCKPPGKPFRRRYPAAPANQSCSRMLRRDVLTLSLPLYSMNPSRRNLVMKKFTRVRVAPIISASVSCEIVGTVR